MNLSLDVYTYVYIRKIGWHIVQSVRLAASFNPCSACPFGQRIQWTKTLISSSEGGPGANAFSSQQVFHRSISKNGPFEVCLGCKTLLSSGGNCDVVTVSCSLCSLI